MEAEEETEEERDLSQKTETDFSTALSITEDPTEAICTVSASPLTDTDPFLSRFLNVLKWELKLSGVAPELVDGLMQVLPAEDDPASLLSEFVPAICNRMDLVDVLVTISKERLHKQEQAQAEAPLNQERWSRGLRDSPERQPDMIEGLFKEEDFIGNEDEEAERRLQEGVETLSAVFPTVSSRAITFVLREEASGDVDAAIEYLLMQSDSDFTALESRALAREKQRAEEARDIAAQKKFVLDKYEYKPDLPKYNEKGELTVKPIKPNVFITANPELGGGQPKRRYRDSQVVTQRGEKFIVEKREEYDGGSRGRVMPKGKRGPGWI